MRRRTSAAVLAGVALAFGSPFAAFAQTTPAPDGSAEGATVRIKDVLGVSESSARAGGADAESSASVLRVGKEPLADALTAKAKGNAKQSNSLVDLKDSDEPKYGRLRIGAADAESSVSEERRAASAAAAVARLFIVPLGLEVHLLESASQAEHTQMKSSGSAFSNGGRVVLGEHTAEVLHSEVSSSGEGSTYLIGLDGTKIGETSESCTLTVPNLAGISCLSVAGGEGSAVTATVFGVDVVPEELDALDSAVVTASGTRGEAGAPVATAAVDTGGAAITPAPAVDGPTEGALAATGADAFTIIAGALLLTALGGLALQIAGRRGLVSA